MNVAPARAFAPDPAASLVPAATLAPALPPALALVATLAAPELDVTSLHDGPQGPVQLGSDRQASGPQS